MPGNDSAFWPFSLRFYRRPEVPPLCLALQDACGVDVNCLFFVLFLAVNGRALSVADVRRIDDHTRAWRSRVVQPLRAIRRAMKDGVDPVDAPAAVALRDAIKRNELEAEHLQQLALERAFPTASTGVAAAPRDAAAANLDAYGRVVGAMPPERISALITALNAEFSL